LRANWKRKGRITDAEAQKVNEWLLEGKASTEIAQMMGVTHAAIIYRKRKLEEALGKKIDRTLLLDEASTTIRNITSEEELAKATPVEWLTMVRDNADAPWGERVRCAQAVLRATRAEVEVWEPPADNEVWVECLAWALAVQPDEVRSGVISKLVERAEGDKKGPQLSEDPVS
jgi:hypothetical protein